MSGRTLTDADVAAVAAAIAETVQLSSLDEHLTVAQVAERLAVSTTWVYENSADLGAVRLGDGERAPLRFSATAIASYLSHHASAATSQPGSRTTLRRRRRVQPRDRRATA